MGPEDVVQVFTASATARAPQTRVGGRTGFFARYDKHERCSRGAPELSGGVAPARYWDKKRRGATD